MNQESADSYFSRLVDLKQKEKPKLSRRDAIREVRDEILDLEVVK